MSDFKSKINKDMNSIWRYADFYDEFINPENRLFLDNWNLTSIVTGNKYLHNFYFKREDKNLTGSLKDRSLVYQISLARQNRKKELVISTSGNAGIAAAAYCQKAGIKLYIFISPKTEKAKVLEMQKYNSIIIKSKRAIRLANYLAAKRKIENLRPSVNDSSIEGFKSIAFEIFEELCEVDTIFTYVTSGSSFIGIGRAYKYLLETGEIKKMPKLYAVQSGNIFSIVELSLREAIATKQSRGYTQNVLNTGLLRRFLSDNRQKTSRNDSSAGKLGVKNTRRKKEILDLVRLSNGSGIYVDDNEIEKAKNILEKNKIYTSSEGCASFAGGMKINKKNRLDKNVCILSGKLRKENGEVNEAKILRAEDFDDVDKIVNLKSEN